MSDVAVQGRWRLRERNRKTGLVVAERTIGNLWTNYGLTALASGLWEPTNTFLCVESNYATFTVQANPGNSSVTLTQAVSYAGDASIILSPGLATQEILAFNTQTTDPDTTVTYGLVGTCALTHPVGDPVCRQVY